jgi:hypothetical protein
MDNERYHQAVSNRDGARSNGAADHRMQRSVAARLSNSNLSLYQALRIGGFEYPDDDDMSCSSRDSVSLGQRKRELLELLRNSSQSQQQGAASISQSDSRPNSYASQQSPARNTPESAIDSQKYFPGAISLSEWPLSSSMQLFQSNPSESLAATISAQQNMFMHQQPMSGTPRDSPMVPPPSSSYAVAPVPNFFQTEAPSPFSSLPPYTSVAVASLTATAQRNNLTLEQLATVLSKKRNLAQLLSNDAKDEDKRRRIALNLFKTESKSLYRKCMLLAGYKAEECEEGCRSHLEFALEAWQAEGLRLQEANSKMNNASGGIYSNASGSQGKVGAVGDSLNAFEFR